MPSLDLTAGPKFAAVPVLSVKTTWLSAPVVLKPVPVKVSAKLFAPAGPVCGLRPVSTGVVVAKLAEVRDIWPRTVTVTALVALALAGRVTIAVSEEAEVDLIVCVSSAAPLKRMTFSVAVALKPVPVKVSVKPVAPAGPDVGAMDATAGVAAKVMALETGPRPTLTVTA